MRCLDASFVVDLLAGDPAAARKAAELEVSGERLSISVPAMAEVLMGAHFAGGGYLRKTLELMAGLEVLPADAAVGAEAGELGAELMRRGERPAHSHQRRQTERCGQNPRRDPQLVGQHRPCGVR